MILVYTLHRETVAARPLLEVFDFFQRPENLERLTPPWLHFRILTPLPIEMREGATIVYRLHVKGVPVKWVTEIELWNPPFEFVDTQQSGPYKLWRHTHQFLQVNGGTRIVDIVNYTLPFGPLGKLVHRAQVARDITRIFDYREGRVAELFGC